MADEFQVGPDAEVRFMGMSHEEVDAEVTRLDVGMRPPEGSTLEEMSAHFENQGRLDVLMDALGRWPSTQVVDAAIRAAKEHGVTRVEVRLPPNAEDE